MASACAAAVTLFLPLQAQAACTGPTSDYHCDGSAPVVINHSSSDSVGIYNASGVVNGPFTPASGSDITVVNDGAIGSLPGSVSPIGLGIFTDQSAGGASSVVSNGTVTGSSGGIHMRHWKNEFNASLTTNAAVSTPGGGALAVTHAGSGNIFIRVNAGVTAAQRAIGSYHVGTGTSEIDLNAASGGSTLISSGLNGVFIGNTTDSGFTSNAGEVVVNVGSGVTVDAVTNAVFANVYSASNVVVNNRGRLTSGSTGSTAVVNLQGNTTHAGATSERLVVNNTGTIERKGGAAFAVSTANAGLTLINDGAITGSVRSAVPANQDNTIADEVTLRAGSLAGNIQLYNGDDVVKWTGGTYAGTILLGNGSDQLTVSTGNIGGASVVFDGGDDVSAADGMVDTLTLKDLGAPVTLAGANLANWEIIRLENARVTLSDGALTTGSEPALGLFIDSRSTLTAGTALALTGNASVSPGGSFIGNGAGAGQYLVSAQLDHQGSIALGNGAAGDVVTAGTYLTGGGHLAIDTVLAGDGSASDRLVVNGDVRIGSGGPTVIDVTNANGAGAEAPGGILLVTVNGASPAGAFVLGGPAIVNGYVYALEQVGPNWYLKSTKVDLLPQTISFTSTPPATPGVGAGTYAASATATSGLPVTLTSTTPAVCTIAGGTVTFVGIGTCTLAANQPGDNTYLPANQVLQSFEVKGAPNPGAATPVPVLHPAALALLGTLAAVFGMGALRRREHGR